MPPSDRIIIETPVRVRYAETDAMGVVHHGSYVVYLEEARTNYARQRGSAYSDFEQSGYYLLVAEIHLRYLKAARYDQRLVVRCWLEEMKSRALTFNYEIVDEVSGELIVTGFSKHVCVTRDGSVATIPAAWRAWSDKL